MNEDPAVLAIEAKFVKEISECDWAKDVDGEVLPVVVHFYGTESQAPQAFGPRFGAVAEKFSGKARFMKISQPANAGLAAKLGVKECPTIVFLQGGKEKGERLSGGETQRSALKARVEALIGIPAAAPSAAPVAEPPK